MGEAYTPPTLSWHAALRWVERAAGLEADVRETRNALAEETGRKASEVSDRAVLERMGIDRKALARRLITPGISAAIEAGVHSIQIDGITFMVNDQRICTAVRGQYTRQERTGKTRKASDNYDERKGNKARRKARRELERKRGLRPAGEVSS